MKYHYIFTGAGCAGLSLLVRLLQTGKYSDKKILLIDKSPKTVNDRTWCFWENEPGYFEPVVCKSWDRLWFHGEGYSKLHTTTPYRYKMIRGEDFYRYCFQIIQQYPNVTIQYGTIDKVVSEPGEAAVTVNGTLFRADYIFNSILFSKPVLKNNQYYLLQHFKGWVIETTHAAFDPSAATFMDFRVSQSAGTTFVYVMPLTENKALIEYTLFTENLLKPSAYDAGLKDYIQTHLQLSDYSIKEEEFGIIPMTNYSFPVADGNVINIGTAGGQTKASTGYTFRFIQKQADRIVSNLLHHNNPLHHLPVPARRFRLYDSTLLNILSQKKLPGDFIFTELFKKNNFTDILKFLDNETSFFHEMKIITVLPKGVFMKAALQELF